MAAEDSHSTDSSVSDEEGQSDPLRVAAEAGVRLLMCSLYSYIFWF